MRRCDSLVARGMVVNTHGFALVYSYVDCWCATAYYTPTFNDFVWKVVREISKGVKEI